MWQSKVVTRKKNMMSVAIRSKWIRLIIRFEKSPIVSTFQKEVNSNTIINRNTAIEIITITGSENGKSWVNNSHASARVCGFGSGLTVAGLTLGGFFRVGFFARVFRAGAVCKICHAVVTLASSAWAFCRSTRELPGISFTRSFFCVSR